MTSPFLPIPEINKPQPQTVNMILRSLGANVGTGGGDVSPPQQGYVPPVNATPQALQYLRARAVSAYDYGVVDNGRDQKLNLISALTAAEIAGGGSSVVLPPANIRIDGGLQLAGYSCGLVGSGSSAISGLSRQRGTVLDFRFQTGPAVDFTGFLYPRGQRGKVTFADFAVKGDGAVGRKGVLLDTGEGGSSGINLVNLVIYNTGDIGLHIKDHYLSEIIGVVVCNPINSASLDIPWILLEGANGNRYVGLGLRSLNFNDTVADVPPSGALRMLFGSVFQHHRSMFVAPWFENCHVGQDSAMVVTQTNTMSISDPQFFDCYRVVGTTNTTHFRLESPALQDYGGNTIRGVIPGKGGGAANEIESGIDVRQSANHIHGIKGFGGNNVLVAPAVNYITAMLSGAELPGNNSAFVDNSGTNTNTLIDMAQGTWIIGERPGAGFTRIAGAYQNDLVLARGTVTADFNFTALTGKNIFTATLGANVAITAITSNSSQVGRRIVVVLTQDATGSRTVTWPANVKFAGGTAPTLSTAAGKIDSFTFIYNGTHWVEASRAIGA